MRRDNRYRCVRAALLEQPRQHIVRCPTVIPRTRQRKTCRASHSSFQHSTPAAELFTGLATRLMPSSSCAPPPTWNHGISRVSTRYSVAWNCLQVARERTHWRSLKSMRRIGRWSCCNTWRRALRCPRTAALHPVAASWHFPPQTTLTVHAAYSQQRFRTAAGAPASLSCTR